MFRKALLGVVFFFAFAGAADVFAATVELTAFYPTPNVKYKNLNSSSTTCLATTAGQNVYMGYSQASVTADAALPVANQVLQHVPAGDLSNSDLFLSGSIDQEDWIVVASGAPAPNFQSGWGNYGYGFNDAAYFRDKSGIVHLKGLVRDGAAGTIIFQLPAGYIPAKQELHVVMTGDPATAGRCDIDVNGNVIAQVKSAGVWFSLDGIKFKANGY